MRGPEKFVWLSCVTSALIVSSIVGAQPADQPVSIGHINVTGPKCRCAEAILDWPARRQAWQRGST